MVLVAVNQVLQTLYPDYDAKTGEVKVGGINVKDYDIENLRNQVAVVLQKNVLFSGSILDNLRWGKNDATEEECVKACKLACADEFIEKFPDKYNTHIDRVVQMYPVVSVKDYV